MANYLDLAKKFGQDVDRLKDGEVIRTTLRVKSIKDFKDIFAGNLGPGLRTSNSESLKGSRSDNPAEDLLARLADYVYGTTELAESDADYARQLFPITITVESGQNYTLNTDVVYGPTAPPVVLNYGTLTIAGGSITTLNTILTLNADVVNFGTGQGTKPYHFGILGVDGTQGSTGSPGTSTQGQAGAGSNSQPTSAGICEYSPDGGTGNPGAPGGQGGVGNPGNNGLPSLQANITIGSFVNPQGQFLTFYTRSGAGGTGGTGGAGGAGQQGGNGGSGCDSGCEGTNGGNGGPGGSGGYGGNGGPGGNGVNGNNIFITVPAAASKFMATTADTATYGQGGAPGLGGGGGAGGGAGGGGKHHNDGTPGTQAGGGNPGTAGNPGTQLGNPGSFYINAA